MTVVAPPLVTIQVLQPEMAIDGGNAVSLPDVVKASIFSFFFSHSTKWQTTIQNCKERNCHAIHLCNSYDTCSQQNQSAPSRSSQVGATSSKECCASEVHQGGWSKRTTTACHHQLLAATLTLTATSTDLFSSSSRA